MITLPIGITQQAAGGGVGEPIEFVAGSNYTANNGIGGNHNIPIPTGAVEGDLVVIEANTRAALITGFSGGSSWTQLTDYHISSTTITTPATANKELRTWWKILGPAEPANWTMTCVSEGTDGLVVQCAAFRNAVSLRNFNTLAGQTMPDVTAVSGEALVSFHGSSFGGGDDVTTGVNVPEMTLVNAQGPVGECSNAVSYLLGLSAGAIGTLTWGGNWTGYNFASSMLLTS